MRIKRDKDTLVRYLIILGIILAASAVFVLLYERVIPHTGSILRFVGALITPFAIAWLAAIITKPATKCLINKLHFPASLAVLLVMLLFFAVVTCIIVLFISVLANVLSTLVEYVSDLDFYGENITATIHSIYDKLGLDYQKIIDFISQYKDQIVDIAGQGIGVVVNVAKSTPGAVVLIFVTLVAVFYWCRDEEKVVPVLCNALPKRWRKRGQNTYNNFSNVIGKYIRAQLILISITFAICTIGFFIIGASSPIAMGLFTAVLDIIPILGPGTLLVPWSVWSFIVGDVGFGVSLLVLYAVVSAVRYITEPKIVGDKVGLHPLAALAAVFIGMKLFGLMGLILGPICLAVIMGAYRSHKNNKAAARQKEEAEAVGEADTSAEADAAAEADTADKKELPQDIGDKS